MQPPDAIRYLFRFGFEQMRHDIDKLWQLVDAACNKMLKRQFARRSYCPDDCGRSRREMCLSGLVFDP
jgi:hypothetical protein